MEVDAAIQDERAVHLISTQVVAVEVGDATTDEYVPIDVSFSTADEAHKALQGLQKRVVGGVALSAEPLRPPAKDASCVTSRVEIKVTAPDAIFMTSS